MTAGDLRLPDDAITDAVIAARGHRFLDIASPIERMMMAAFTRAATVAIINGMALPTFGSDGFEKAMSLPIEYAIDFLMFCEKVFISYQHKVGAYTADFAIVGCYLTYIDIGPGALAEGCRRSRPVVIECDGHDFHERTKEQAMHDRQRDRFMQEQGYAVMRFTGAEIYRDPCACVSQALRFCESPENSAK